MNVVYQTQRILATQVLPSLKKRHQKLFSFGVQALTLQSFVSLNGNARMVVGNRSTAESKIFRLCRNQQLPRYFTQLVFSLKLVTPTDTVNVDFSSFGGFEVLTFAKQTHLGRAIPLFFRVLKYPISSPGSQTRFTMAAIEEFLSLLGFCPHLVFDRGFESPYLVPFLTALKIPFTMRFRKDKQVVYRMKKDLPLRNLPWYENDCRVEIYPGCVLRAIVSENKPNTPEPWYLVTNDTQSTREAIIARYYFRFEIEETFKDLKHISKLKRFFPITKPLTLTILLWFSILTIWLAFLVKTIKTYLVSQISKKRRKRLSITRFFYESIQQTKSLLLQEKFAM